MSLLEIIMRLVTVSLLVTYLVTKHRQRLLDCSPPSDPAGWTGTPIDAARLIPSIDRVRGDYVAARHASAHTTSSGSRFRAQARRTIRTTAYFEGRRFDHDRCEQAA